MRNLIHGILVILFTAGWVASTHGQSCPTSIRVGTSCGSSTSCSPCSNGNCCHNCTGTVDVVSFETYTKRVLASEWINCWGSQTGGMNSLQAGAVSIRSYTVQRMANLASCHGPNYDICNNTCCQAYSTTQYTNSNNAVDNTAGYVLVSGSAIQLAEFSAESNNEPPCGNGQKGDGSGAWPCTADGPCTGQTNNGHGRGMCQNGSARWATGLNLVNSTCTWQSAHGYGTKTWQQILAWYYPSWTLTTCGGGCPAPANDACTGAVNLTVSAGSTTCATSGETVACATQSFGANSCGGFTSGTAYDVWFKFTPPATGTYTIEMDPATSTPQAWDGVIELFQGSPCPGSTTNVDCEDPSGGANNATVTLTTTISSLSTHYIRVFDYGSSSTQPSIPTFNLCITAPSTSAADLIITPGTQQLSDYTVTQGQTITAYCAEDNDGSTSAGPNEVTLWLSSDAFLGPDPDDVLLGQIVIPTSVPGLSSSLTYNNPNIQIPANTCAGSYTLFFWADGNLDVTESDNSNNFATVQVTVSGSIATPANPTSNSPQCGNVTVTRTGSPPTGVTWYWQGTSCGTSTSLGSGSTYSAGASGTYYIRARSGAPGNCWSSSCGSIPVTVTGTPSDPANPTSNSPQCGNVTLTRSGSPPAGVTWYWQGTTCGTSMSLGSGTTYTAPASGTYYIRAYNNTGGCWSTGCGSVAVTITGTPTAPANPTSDSPQCGTITITRNGSPPAGVTWYWQGTSCGTSMSLGSGSTYSASSSGTYYIRAYNTIGGCWSSGCGSVAVTVTGTPTSPGNPTSGAPQCGSVTLTRLGSPPAGVTWYWQGTACGTTMSLGSGTTYSATASGTYYIRAYHNTGQCWSSGCGSVPVTVIAVAPVADAGSDQAICSTPGTAVMAGNAAAPGAGMWTQVGGTGPTIVTPNSPTTTITGLTNGTYTFRWTITNPPCAATMDNVNVTVSASATWYEDADADGAGDPSVTQASCTQPTGYVSNSNDQCPGDPDKIEPGQCGCGVADTDSDGDGIANCSDGCPNDPDKVAPGICGCGISDSDSDGDGTADCMDGCPLDPNKTAPGACGCGVPDIDTDSDGIADCNDPCDNGTNGQTCNDGDDCTVNDVLFDCLCAGIAAGDIDSDGICDPIDPCDNNTNGQVCDDGDDCTIDDSLVDCNCIGTPAGDLDSDGICDPTDPCNNNTDGLACDDGDPCTEGESFLGCVCQGGAFLDGDSDGVCDVSDICPGFDDNIDTDGDGLPNGCDPCDNTTDGAACDDGDACTVGETLLNCTCQGGSFQDADLDGVCDAADICPGSDDNEDFDSDGIPNGCDPCDNTTNGQPCSDGDPCTAGETLIDCNCQGGVFQDSDGDTVCDGSDVCTGFDDLADADGDSIPDGCDPCDNTSDGNPCDDGETCTINDVLVNCVCIGTPDSDVDGDGLCDTVDPCNNLTDGQPCDDLDPCTDNDVMLNCTCTGTFADVDSDGLCDNIDPCNDNTDGSVCDDGDPCTTGETLLACNCQGGVFQDSDGDTVCDASDACPGFDDLADADGDGTPNGCDPCNNTTDGQICDDGEPCTINDVLLACACAGTPAGDSDNDGVCDPIDLCDNNTDGDPCDDLDPCTTNDAMLDCTCTGTPSGDVDGDGVCDAIDPCNDNTDGTACDLDPCLLGETWLDCICQGGFAIDLTIDTVFGPTDVPTNSTVTYWVNPVPGASGYVWTFSPAPPNLDWSASDSDTTDATAILQTGPIPIGASVCVYAVNEPCAPGNELCISFSTGLGSDGAAFDWFTIYPNPSSGGFQLLPGGAIGEPIEVLIYDARGELVSPMILLSGGKAQVLNLEHKANGLYFLRATRSGESHILELVIQR